MCATNRVPLSYDELTPANVAEARLVGELCWLRRTLLRARISRGSSAGGSGLPRSGELEEELAEAGVLLVTERSAQGGKRQQAEIAFSSLKRVFGIDRTLATTLIGLSTRVVAKITAYTYAFYVVNRLLGKPQGRMKELWA